MTNRRSGVKLFLSVITAPIVLAHLINFLNRGYHVNSPRLAYSKYKHVRANTIGVVNVHFLNTQSRCVMCDGLVLLVKICNASPNRRDNAYL
jgi:hypothetical protein